MSHFEDMFRLTMAMRNAYDSRTTAVSALRDASSKQLAQLQAEHREMAVAQRKELSQFAETLQQTVSSLIHDLNVERATLNADQRRHLDAFAADLRHDMADFLRERAAERRANDASQHQRLDDFIHSLRERTASYLAEVHAARMAIRADQHNAQQAWKQFTTEMRQRRTGWSQPTNSEDRTAALRAEAVQSAPDILRPSLDQPPTEAAEVTETAEARRRRRNNKHEPMASEETGKHEPVASEE